MSIDIKRKNNKKPTRYYSNLQEKRVAKEVGGTQTPNSGAASIKGDVLTDTKSYDTSFLIECKTKTKNSDSIVIKREWFIKNKYEASEMGKGYQALVFNFGPDKPYNKNYYIIDEYLFKELQNYLEEMKNS